MTPTDGWERITISYANPFVTISAMHVGWLVWKPMLDRVDRPVLRIDGGMIIHTHQWYEYLVDGKLVAQRVGCSEELLKLFVKYGMTAGDYDLQFKIQQEMKGIL